MIAGTYNDIQGGIAHDGIAHAGTSSLEVATWFDGLNDYISTVATVYGSATIAFVVAEFKTGVASSLIRIGNNADCLIRYLSTNALQCRNVYVGGTPANIFGIAGYRTTTLTPIVWTFTVSGGNRIHNLYIGQAFVATRTVAYQALFNEGNADVGSIGGSGGDYSQGVIRSVAYYNYALSGSDAIAYDGETIPGTPAVVWPGTGISDQDWGTGSVVYGSPDPAYITGNGKIIVNGVVMNP